VILAPAALAAALCLYALGSRSLWFDEAASVAIAAQHGGAFGAALAHDGGNMLAYYALLHVLIGGFGASAVVIRLPAAIGAVASVALLSGLALRLFGRRAAAVAGVVAAVSLPLVYYGQNARGYTLMIAFICASWLAFVWLLDTRAGSWGPGAVYGVLTTAALYCGLEAVLVIPAQLLVLVWHRRRAAPVLVALSATAACAAPLAILAAGRGTNQLFWIPRPGYKTLRQIVQALGSTGLEPSFYTTTGGALLFLTLGLALAGAVWVGRAWLDRRRRAEAWPGALVLAWLLLPMAITVAVSELGHSFFQPRYLLVSLPAVALLLAGLLDRLWQVAPQNRPRWAWLQRCLAVGLLAALVSLRALQLAPSYGKSSEPWRTVARYVTLRSRPGDCLAFYPLDVRMPFRYYVAPGPEVPRPVLPALAWRQIRPYVEEYSLPPWPQLAGRLKPCRRLWLVASHAGEADGTPVSQANYARYFGLVDNLESRFPSFTGAAFGPFGIIGVTLFSG
jgi:mannosyltransferase